MDLLSYSALYNKDFIYEFTAFLSVTVPTCDNFLILGDFNIHVCCPFKPLASEFLQLIDSFNFTQVCVRIYS